VFIKGSISRSEIGRGALKYGGRKAWLIRRDYSD
jgi:hypothetical protein